jgi:hypothetical protein
VAKATSDGTASAEERITAILAKVGDWRGETLGRIRDGIRKAAPGVVEEVKWVKPSNPDGVPTWSHDGILCTGEIYKDKVKLSFMEGAALPDPEHLFNASLDAGTRRCIDLREGDDVDPKAFVALIKAAVAHNRSKAAAKGKR